MQGLFLGYVGFVGSVGNANQRNELFVLKSEYKAIIVSTEKSNNKTGL